MAVSIQHPFLESYQQVNLECGSPPHFCDDMTFYKLKEFNCPACNTPFTTANIWKETIQKLQTTLQNAMKARLQLFVIQKKANQAGLPIPEDPGYKEIINSVIGHVNGYLDAFPFRDVPGLECSCKAVLQYRKSAVVWLYSSCCRNNTSS